MAELTDDMFEDILKEIPSQYFYYKEDTGKIEVLMKSPIEKIEPGEEDLIGRVWNPPVEDAQGNPIMNRDGSTREPWAIFQAKCEINGVEHVLGLGGERGAFLRTFAQVMKSNDIKNSELDGTKWSIFGVREKYWNYTIQYIGRGDESESPSTNTNIDNKIVEALKVKKDMSEGGLAKNDVIAYLAVTTSNKAKDIESQWKDFIDSKLIKEEKGKVYIL